MDDNERKVFWDTLSTLEGKDLIAEAEKLKPTIKYPKYLYRYRHISLSTLDALQENKLYFSPASCYDDPFDTFLHIDWFKVKENIVSRDIKSDVEKIIIPFLQYIKFNGGVPLDADTVMNQLNVKNILETTVKFLNETIRPEIQNNSFAICFGESGKNENLWLKYADHHKGFCLVYDLENNENFRCGKAKECGGCVIQKEHNYALYPVHYSSEKYDATEYAINCAIGKILKDFLNIKSLSEQFYSEKPSFWERERTSLIKHECHKYDQEWRYLLGTVPNNKTCFNWIPDAVILGQRIEDLHAKMIIRAAKAAGIKKIKRAVIKPNDEFDIEDVPEEVINKLLNP